MYGGNFMPKEVKLISKFIIVVGIELCNKRINEESLVVVRHQHTPKKSLLFVHTARRSYQKDFRRAR